MTEFFSCDWGTTSFRLRLVNAFTGMIMAERREASGVNVLLSKCAANDPVTRAREYESFLRNQLLLSVSEPAALNGAIVHISGMASSSVGWHELPYASVPIDLDGSGFTQEEFFLEIQAGVKVRIFLISGVRSETDIMRGEETEILGLFAGRRHPEVASDGIVLLPGTHSKHVRLRERRISRFRTFMTGELFDVLSTHSLLRASVSARGIESSLNEPAAKNAFIEGVHTATATGLIGNLFQTRVRTVLQNVSPAINRWFLSGLLIGAEVADLAVREVNLPLLLAAVEPLSTAYQLAFGSLGLLSRVTLLPPAEVAAASVRGHWVLLRRALGLAQDLPSEGPRECGDSGSQRAGAFPP